ncbi:hypothetical protein J4Q44_G00288060 [Coregonus suidteri]|uniref:Uncharacterized protein n=1 Tax=Coregonus suidteri TaxID=861788 RepID=A0AAN8QKB4_9TELE
MEAGSSSCSRDNALSCEVGDLTTRQGTVSLTHRQLYTDTSIQLAGDYTVVHRGPCPEERQQGLGVCRHSSRIPLGRADLPPTSFFFQQVGVIDPIWVLNAL